MNLVYDLADEQQEQVDDQQDHDGLEEIDSTPLAIASGNCSIATSQPKAEAEAEAMMKDMIADVWTCPGIMTEWPGDLDEMNDKKNMSIFY